MEFREREGTSFEEAERRYAELARWYDAGLIDEEEFDVERQRLLVRDDKGKWWAKSRETGQWLYHDGDGAWIEATPPIFYRRVIFEDSPEQPGQRPAAQRPGGNNRLVIGLGILCTVLAVGLTAALAYSLIGRDTTGGTEPKTASTPSSGSPSSFSESPVGSHKTVSVVGNRPWTDTGLDVAQGSSITITANGAVKVAGGSEPGKTPDGSQTCVLENGVRPERNDFIAPDLNCWSLIGRIDTSAPFEVGTSKTLSAPTAGRLYLGVNDGRESFRDNSEKWAADITVS